MCRLFNLLVVCLQFIYHKKRVRGLYIIVVIYRELRR